MALGLFFFVFYKLKDLCSGLLRETTEVSVLGCVPVA